MSRVTRAVAGLVAITAATAIAAAVAPQAQAAAPTSRLYFASLNTCVDVSTTDPAHYFLDIYGAKCNGSAAQTFTFSPLPGATVANTFEVKNNASGKCLDKYRSSIRQTNCGGGITDPGWTFRQVGTTGTQYNMIIPYTAGAATPVCLQVNPKPSGYPGPLFSEVSCSGAASQVITLTTAP